MIRTYIQHIILRWKLVLDSGRLAAFIFILPLLISLGVGIVFKDYSTVDQVPIAIVDLDETPASTALIERLVQLDSLSVTVADESSALRALKDNRIEALFSIQPGFETMLLSGQVDDRVEITVLENNMVAGALGDIFAREILKDLSVYSASNKAYRLLDSENAQAEAMALTRQFIRESTFELDLNITLTSPDQIKTRPDTEGPTTQQLMRNRLTVGMTLASTAFFMVFVGASIIEERKMAAFSRLKCAGQPRILGAYLGYFSFGSLLLFLQFLALSLMTGLFTVRHLPGVFAVCVAFVSSLCGIMLFFAVQFDRSTAFQSMAAPAVFFICLSGGAFWSLDLIPDSFKIISKLTPIYWSMEALMNLTLGSTVNVLALVLVFLTGGLLSYTTEKIL